MSSINNDLVSYYSKLLDEQKENYPASRKATVLRTLNKNSIGQRKPTRKNQKRDEKEQEEPYSAIEQALEYLETHRTEEIGSYLCGIEETYKIKQGKNDIDASFPIKQKRVRVNKENADTSAMLQKELPASDEPIEKKTKKEKQVLKCDICNEKAGSGTCLCPKCQQWYHLKCVGITVSKYKKETFKCPNCSE
uniref:PHD-type domain-containing protein n=1 Tax=Caenorhabditis tropicalis TaxID=1561998 RepID=A0A1I7TRK5_9PELO